MGTPDFAVESLRALVEGGYHVVAVVTMPDKPVGRHGSVLQPSPVKQYAVEHGLNVMQPEKLKDPAFVEELRSLKADLQIVVAFRMLPEIVWSMPPLGTFNAHASLLPKYRGAAPINWAVINGETETGITTFFLKHEIDTGDIIQQVHNSSPRRSITSLPAQSLPSPKTSLRTCPSPLPRRFSATPAASTGTSLQNASTTLFADSPPTLLHGRLWTENLSRFTKRRKNSSLLIMPLGLSRPTGETT